MTIILSCDHGGYELKEQVKKYLADKYSAAKVVDVGAPAYDGLDAFPIYIEELVKTMRAASGSIGIAICGTGIGVSIAANRYFGMRAALCHSTEYAKLAREHNDANILCLGGRFIGLAGAKKIIDTFLNTEHLGGKYKVRMDELDKLQQKT